MSIYRCLVLTVSWKFARFQVVKEQSVCKRLSIYSDSRPSTSAAGQCFLRSAAAGFGVGVLVMEAARTFPRRAPQSGRLGNRRKDINNREKMQVLICFCRLARDLFCCGGRQNITKAPASLPSPEVGGAGKPELLWYMRVSAGGQNLKLYPIEMAWRLLSPSSSRSALLV